MTAIDPSDEPLKSNLIDDTRSLLSRLLNDREDLLKDVQEDIMETADATLLNFKEPSNVRFGQRGEILFILQMTGLVFFALGSVPFYNSLFVSFTFGVLGTVLILDGIKTMKQVSFFSIFLQQ